MKNYGPFLFTTALLSAMLSAKADQAAMNSALSNWENQIAEYKENVKKAQTPDQYAAIQQPNAEKTAQQLWQSVKGKKGKRMRNGNAVTKYEYDEPWAAKAVVWFLNHPQEFAQVFSGKQKRVSFFANAMIESVEHTHYASPHIAEACAKLAQSPSVRIYELLQKIYTRNADYASKANAAMAMSILLSNPTIASAEGSPEAARSKQLYFLRQAILLAPENTMFGDITLAEMAKELSYALEHLSLDSIPPQIELIDINGNKVLFPTPGKATLLFFWTPQESIGLDIVRRQDKLLQQFPDLQICPITAHDDIQEWKDMLTDLEIPCSYMDNEQNSAGVAYRVSQLPMAVLVNERCRILFIGFPNQQLQAALNNYYAEQQKSETTQEEEEPIIQPGSQPVLDTQSGDTPPPLRDMPEF